MQEFAGDDRQPSAGARFVLLSNLPAQVAPVPASSSADPANNAPTKQGPDALNPKPVEKSSRNGSSNEIPK